MPLILCLLYADRNSHHDASCLPGRITHSRMAPVFLQELQSVSTLHKHITTRKRTKTPNSLKASASRKCGSGRIVRNMILLPPLALRIRASCLSRTLLRLKIMLAHTVLDYDVEIENEGVRPPDVWLASSCIPNMKGKVMFRKCAT